MRLYLDDIRDIPFGWMGARTVEEAKKHAMAMHARGCFDECSLDHDLGYSCESCRAKGQSWCDHCNGLQFVDWMIETGIWPKEKPRVHSMNPSGAQRMRMAIERHFKVADPAQEKG
jgi:hypothetical protein